MGKATVYCRGCGSAFRDENADPDQRCSRCRPAEGKKPSSSSFRRARPAPGTTRRPAPAPRRNAAVYVVAGGLLLALVLAAGFGLARRTSSARAQSVDPPRAVTP